MPASDGISNIMPDYTGVLIAPVSLLIPACCREHAVTVYPVGRAIFMTAGIADVQ